MEPSQVVWMCSNDKTLMLFLKGVPEAVDHVNYGKRQLGESGIHKCHATGSSTNGRRPRVGKINSSFLLTAIGTYLENELIYVISLGLDFWSKKEIQ